MTTAVLDRPQVEESTDHDTCCTVKYLFSERRCNDPAAWRGVFRCCGYVKVICQKHYDWTVVKQWDFVQCMGCKHRFAEENPFMLWEPIK